MTRALAETRGTLSGIVKGSIGGVFFGAIAPAFVPLSKDMVRGVRTMHEEISSWVGEERAEAVKAHSRGRVAYLDNYLGGLSLGAYVGMAGAAAGHFMLLISDHRAEYIGAIAATNIAAFVYKMFKK